MSISKNANANLSVQVYNTSGQPFVPAIWPNDGTAKMYLVTDGNGTAIEVTPTRQDALTGYWRLTSSILTSSIMNCDELKLSWFGTGIQTGGALFLTEALFTDTLGGNLSAYLTDFSGTVRPWILTVWNSVYDAISGRSLLQRVGGFTGTGSNTLLGFLLAIMRKNAPIPSDVGGTYEPAIDSLEAIRERGDSAWLTGGGGGGGTVNEALQLNSTDTIRQITTTPYEIVAANGQTINVKVQRGQTVYFANTSGTITTNDVATAVSKEVTSEDGFKKLKFANKCFVYTLEGTARITYTIEA